MAKKPGNLLIKLAVLIAVAAAVFFALDSWRKQAAVPPAAETTPAESPAAPALSREEAERIGTEIGTRIGTEIGTQIGREVAAQMLAERKAQLEAMKKKPASAPPPTAAPAAEPVAAASVETAAAEPEPTPAPSAPKPARREARTQGTIPGSPVAQPAAGRDPWWIKSSSSDADALVLTYAGHFKSSDGSQSGIALMFSGRFDNQTDFSAISISGGTVPGNWRLGVNRGLIYLPGVPSGSYTVTVKSGFRDADGKTLKTEVSGPVDVP
jgi:hypothetical protein